MSLSSLYHSDWQSDEDLFSFVFRSSAMHIFFALLLWGLSFVLSMEFRANKEANIVLVEGSVRVDVVAMPTHTLRELQTLQQLASNSAKQQPVAIKAETTKEAPAPIVADNSKAPVIEVETEPKESLMDVLRRKAQQKVEPSKSPQAAATQSPATTSQLSATEQQRLRQLVAAGNRISEGVSLSGSGSGAEMTAFNKYISALPDQVRVHWRLPSFLADQDLRARIRIYLKNNGELVRTEIFESSGNADYDRRAIEAIRLAQPFPALAEEFSNRAARGDIVLGFPL